MERSQKDQSQGTKTPKKTHLPAHASDAGAGSSSSTDTLPSASARRQSPAGVTVWIDDPQNGQTALRPVPALDTPPLQIRIADAALPEGQSAPGEPGFRYWTAAESLRRCADFWLARMAGLTWHGGDVLPVYLDDGLDFNAYYDRDSLRFFHGALAGRMVYSGESPDVLCHEMGHAVLDAIKPELWNVASNEIAAFHEAFGDMSAILTALQLPEMRAHILEETGGVLNRSSPLSRMAEQLGAAIRAHHPDAVDPDCLRNACNRFLYTAPMLLDASGPASVLSAESHSFSRVFSGAFLDGLAGMLAASAARASAPTEAELLQVSTHMGDILVAGVRRAAVASNFYAQVAAAMLEAAALLHPGYPRALKAAFIKRDILSLQSAASVESLSAVARGIAAGAAGQDGPAQPPSQIALDGVQYGLGATALIVDLPSQPKLFSINATASDGGPRQPASSEAAARRYVEDLFKRGRVDYGDTVSDETRMDPLMGLKTHRLTATDHARRLVRVLCDCGFYH
jgi:hypothetical protein